MTNIHNHNPRRALERIQESNKISEENKNDMRKFYKALKKGKARRERYLSTGKQILEYEENDFRLKRLEDNA